ncbi:MAG TPA: hypothetical protein VM911_09320 [Pyrinomonadaceae bacterium]|nr:hypothetical protein [Pyrinomonadaceae bacterium]
MGKLKTYMMAVALMLMMAATASAQAKMQKKFEAVPEHLRARLIERLELYVEYERTSQYEKLYELLLDSIAVPLKLDRDAYVAASKRTIAKGYRSVLLKFKAQWTLALSLNDDDVVRYDIWGAAKVSDGKKIYEKEAAIEARWINGDWYFSGVADVIID